MEATINNFIISVKTKYINNISEILKRAEIQNNSSVSPTDFVNIVGVVESIPKKITTEIRGYEGFSTKDILVGDTVIFRYDVIYDFKQLSQNERTYKNLFGHNAKEYWLCDVQKIFGIIRNNEIKMVNGYVMLEDYEEANIILSAHLKRSRKTKETKIMHIGNPKEGDKGLDAIVGDTVMFDENKVAKYQINGKDFRIIQQKFILGKKY